MSVLSTVESVQMRKTFLSARLNHGARSARKSFVHLFKGGRVQRQRLWSRPQARNSLKAHPNRNRAANKRAAPRRITDDRAVTNRGVVKTIFRVRAARLIVPLPLKGQTALRKGVGVPLSEMRVTRPLYSLKQGTEFGPCPVLISVICPLNLSHRECKIKCVSSQEGVLFCVNCYVFLFSGFSFLRSSRRFTSSRNSA